MEGGRTAHRPSTQRRPAKFALLSGTTFAVALGSINVQNSPGATVIVGSQVGNQVAVGGPVWLSAGDRPLARA